MVVVEHVLDLGNVFVIFFTLKKDVLSFLRNLESGVELTKIFGLPDSQQQSWIEVHDNFWLWGQSTGVDQQLLD